MVLRRTHSLEVRIIKVESDAEDLEIPQATQPIEQLPDAKTQSAFPELSSMGLCEKRIQSIIQNLSSVKFHRNSLLPVMRLSSELLSRVLRPLSLQQPLGSNPNRLGWVAATHVCRRWRRTALGDPELWANIEVDVASEWTAEAFKRAGLAPLQLTIRSVAIPANWDVILEHFHHVRIAKFSELPSGVIDHVTKLLSTSAPMLEELDLEFSGDQALVHAHLVPGTKMFGGHTHKLSKLSLGRLVNPWDTVPCASLTRLEILHPEADIKGAVPSEAAWDSLLSVISENPNLTSLRLEHCLPLPSPLWSPRYRVVDLPQLTCLSLSGLSTSILNVLTALRLPNSTKLLLDCISDHISGTDLSPIISFISMYFGALSATPFQSLYTTFSGPIANAMTLWVGSILPPVGNKTACFDKDFLVGWQDGLPTFDLQLALRSRDSEHRVDLSYIFGQALSMLPLSDLKYICTEVPDGILQRNDWVSLFGRCKQVNIVEISGQGIISFLQAITDYHQPERAGQSIVGGTEKLACVLFPQLSDLSIMEVDLTTAKPAQSGSRILERAIGQRVQSAVVLEYLSIFRCKFGHPARERLMGKLREFIPSLFDDQWEPGTD